MQVRSKHGTGKLLFEWNPETNQVEMVIKGIYYLVDLNSKTKEYKIVEEYAKKEKAS
ncbi:hypothetical protein KQI85_14685 [Falcatimonas sp. MSJ-15]|uniref:hypothetical protein n=1 Tax=Falcatimonas sp. MSJ-15 TaxID=2841515 RepID=UPI001C125F95|nr:hypothetical protein [Falcatimonas sp. MSJ-15]MBU5471586.1 hypothetical protein [Falcatimonas sp. MSJ-15]